MRRQEGEQEKFQKQARLPQVLQEERGVRTDDFQNRKENWRKVAESDLLSLRKAKERKERTRKAKARKAKARRKVNLELHLGRKERRDQEHQKARRDQ